ncbi:MAG: peptidase [Flavobacteriaceae bacterium]|nr:peptidase [Flavobacteriaceae bacterium]
MKGTRIPLGSEIISINGHSKDQLLRVLGKYHTTDGYNTTGKKIGICIHFSKYYRYNFGLSDNFKVVYKKPRSKKVQSINITNVSYKKYYQNFDNRHSVKTDNKLFENIKKSDYYSLHKLNTTTAILTINSFSLGSDNDKTHLKYKSFLDSIFIDLNQRNYKNIIVDIRNNGGGTSPNDMITLSYLINSPQKEIRTAWVSFTEWIPYWKYFQIDIPFYLKPFAKSKLKKIIQEELPIVKNNRRYYKDILTYQPNINSFKGQVYLLTGPWVASAASLFASMLASNTEAIVIGEETSGGYYGHNGAFPVEYKLPKSKFTTRFSIVNLTQDVLIKDTQPFGRGIIPDFNIEQSFNDFIYNKDTQMNFTIDLIKKNK